ncbi:MAG: hypothetical protein JWO13_432 [Acidobacteriales bacterium]|nr:hypothetical protein [Terriglobales bacterium]
MLTLMNHLTERIAIALWNWLTSKKPRSSVGELTLGNVVSDGQIAKHRVTISSRKRTEHIAILGRTGSGKSTLLRFMAEQDIRAGRGFIYFDFHGDATPLLLKAIAAEELRTGKNLATQTIVIDPSDPIYSVGLNPLEIRSGLSTFVEVAESTKIIKDNCDLDSLGAQTEELLRNSLISLADNALTLIELVPFLANQTFRSSLMNRVQNPEVRSYFESRFDQVSDAMRRTMIAPVLNKTSAFTADPHFRHILGQKASTFSIVEAMDSGWFVILCLPKPRLGEQVATLSSMLVAKVKNEAFRRRRRELFTIYADEIQNIVSSESSVEVLFSELRKFGIGIVAANQYLDQYPPQLRSAVLAIGTHICFQLSSNDAEKMFTALSGGKALSEKLRSLPHRQFVIKSGSESWHEAIVPKVQPTRTDHSTLLNRSRLQFARLRSEVEEQIAQRHPRPETTTEEALDVWQ